MTAHIDHLNTSILKMLGINHKNITRAELELLPSKSPTVTLTQVLIDMPLVNGEVAQQTIRAVLVPLPEETAQEPVSFDLDAECLVALHRVQKHIYSRAALASSYIHYEHQFAVQHMEEQFKNCLWQHKKRVEYYTDRFGLGPNTSELGAAQ